MILEKFYINNLCQCFLIKYINDDIRKMFGKNKYLLIFYNNTDCNCIFSDNLYPIYTNSFSFFYMFALEEVPMDRIMGSHKKSAVKNMMITEQSDKYIEYLTDNNIYFIPMPSNKKVSFQILDKQLIKITNLDKDDDVLSKIIKKYNTTNKDRPIDVKTIIRMLSLGYGVYGDICNGECLMINFIDKYNDKEYVPINKSSIRIGYVFQAKTLKEEVNNIKTVESIFENLEQKVVLYETLNHPITELLKIHGAKKINEKAIEIKFSDLCKSNITWSITDFIC